MNKIKLGLVALTLVGLVGCSSGSKTKTTTCTLEQSYVKIKYTYESDGDKLKKMTIDKTIDTSKLNQSEEDLQAVADEFKDLYDIDGMTYKTTIKDDKFIEVIKIDMDKADIDELAEVKVVDKSENEKATHLSLKKTLETIEAVGATCKK